MWSKNLAKKEIEQITNYNLSMRSTLNSWSFFYTLFKGGGVKPLYINTYF